MRKTKLLCFLLAVIFLLPSLFACKSDGQKETATDNTSVSETDNNIPNTEITPSEDGSTVVVYKLSVKNSGRIIGSTRQTLTDGNKTSKVEILPGLGYEFKQWSDGSTDPMREGDLGNQGMTTTYFAVLEPEALEMPIINITTIDGHAVTSKTEFVSGYASLSNCDDRYAFEDMGMMIRGRGNFSWRFDKKSYRIKFDEKVNLLGIGECANKSWNLISNHCDQSLLRNYTALTFASMMSNIAYSPACISVEVYFNGIYNGVYLLCEAIQAKNGRVDINRDIESGTDIGYLVQMTNYAEIPMFTIDEKKYEIKSDLSTDPALASSQSKYIEDYMRNCYSAVLSGEREKIEELIDLPSMIDTYIVEETVKNLDVGWDSFYFYKDSGSKLYFGPIWDFDLALGNADEGCQYYTDLHAAKNGMRQSHPWYATMMSYGWFREMVAERYKSKEVQEILASLPDVIQEKANKNYQSLCRNFNRWSIFGQKLNREPPEIVSLKNYDQHYKYLIEWLSLRIEFLNSFIGSERYDQGYNTQSGGTSVIVPSTPDNMGFAGGTGTAEDPYIIANADNFAKFTDYLLSGYSFENKYFKQSANIDMTQVKTFAGSGSTATFAGFYNGGGYTIHAVIEGTDQCLFPYVTGTVVNLATTGSINNTNQAAGICRSVRSGGSIINCYSLMDLSSGTGQAAGIAASTQSGDLYILNCYFGGSILGNGGAICVWRSDRSGHFDFLYSSQKLGATNVAPCETLLSEDQMNEHLANIMNQNIDTLANQYGIDRGILNSWTKGEKTADLKTS